LRPRIPRACTGGGRSLREHEGIGRRDIDNNPTDHDHHVAGDDGPTDGSATVDRPACYRAATDHRAAGTSSGRD
jgi:hypothetical protein